MPPLDRTKLLWDVATGYDFFVSLHVLHAPDEFGLRGAWAKGVRTRLPAGAREFLEEAGELMLSALPWVFGLPAEKDAAAILSSLAEIPPRRRFAALLTTPEIPEALVPLLERIAERGAWTEVDREAVLMEWAAHKKTPGEIVKLLDLWARSGDLGEQTLPALQAYHEVFFAEEEERIRPALEEAAARGQVQAASLDLHELLAELSQGVRFEEAVLGYSEWAMAPSFWITPRILVSRLNSRRALFVYGGRPDDASLVPGEAVPDALFNALKALADPTRLRILHYLEEQPQTPSELARTLRLRAPTVIHHLNSLRLAGLVYVTYGKGDKRYAARTSRLAEVYMQLRRYLGISELKVRDDASGRPPYVA